MRLGFLLNRIHPIIDPYLVSNPKSILNLLSLYKVDWLLNCLKSVCLVIVSNSITLKSIDLGFCYSDLHESVLGFYLKSIRSTFIFFGLIAAAATQGFHSNCIFY